MKGFKIGSLQKRARSARSTQLERALRARFGPSVQNPEGMSPCGSILSQLQGNLLPASSEALSIPGFGLDCFRQIVIECGG